MCAADKAKGRVCLVAVVGCAAVLACSPMAVGEGIVTITQAPDRLRVAIDGQPFTEYILRGYPRPILYPVIGPYGIGMTRNWPMNDTAPGEAKDHPHHKSLWFAHRPINGVDFWSESPQAGKTVHDKILKIVSGTRRGEIQTANNWITADGKLIFTDTRTLGFESLGESRAIDWEITLHASQGDLTFGDSKEGSMAIRTHPNLQLDNNPKLGVTTANGRALTSEGVQDQAVWGKRGNWIDYWAKIDGKMVGIAIFDHPANPRHPTWWMARGYGYIGANPFGISAFEGKPAGTGDMTIKAGRSVTFRWRFVFHPGDVREANIEQLYTQYIESGSAVGPAAQGQDCREQPEHIKVKQFALRRWLFGGEHTVVVGLQCLGRQHRQDLSDQAHRYVAWWRKGASRGRFQQDGLIAGCGRPGSRQADLPEQRRRRTR